MPAKLTKKRIDINKKLENTKPNSLEQAIGLSVELSSAKFVESVDVAIHLGVNAKNSAEVVRGRVVLPHGTGRTGLKIAVFAKDEQANIARANGAVHVGFDDLAEEVKRQGKLDADIVLATPEAMRIVGTLGPILGPRNLMPNPKEGTVTTDIAAAIKNTTSGVRFRTEKNGIIHCSIGTAKMAVNELKENFEALIAELRKLKPAISKGVYIRKITISTTMGPGVSVEANLI